MTEVVADHRRVDARLEQCDGAAVAEHVGRHSAAPELGQLGCGRLRVTFKQIGGTIAGEAAPTRVPEDQAIVQPGLSHQDAYRRRRLRPQWTDTVLITLASNPNLSPAAKTEVINGEGKNLGDTRARIEEQQQERVVANARGRPSVGLLQDRSNVLRLKVGDHAAAGTLRANCQDALVLTGTSDITAKEVFNEPMERGQTAVAGRGCVSSRHLQVVEEGENGFHSDVVELETGDGPAHMLREEQQEEAKGVTIGSDRVRARAASALQVVPKVRLDLSKDAIYPSAHARPLLVRRR